MQIATLMSLFGSVMCVSIYAWRRHWVMACAWVFSGAYSLFDRVLQNVIPTPVVSSFAYLFFSMVMFEIIKKIVNRKKQIPSG